MNIRTRDFSFKADKVTAKGEFEGYGSVFDVIDAYGEVIVPGAFTDTLQEWKAKGRLPPVLWQHSSRDPLGPHLEMHEDATGLRVRGQLLVDKVEKAREAHALLESNTIQGLSIGFSVPPDSDAWDSKRSVLLLKKIRLWECSLVTFPANESATVDQVKSVLAGGKLPDLKTFECLLREVGFSRSEAKAIASQGLGKLRREVETTGEEGKGAQLAAMVGDLVAKHVNPPRVFTL